MSNLNGKLAVAFGVMLLLAGLLAFSFAAPTTTVGQETDIPVDDGDDEVDDADDADDDVDDVDDDGSDVDSGAEGPDDDADPPASLPNTGSGDGFSGGVNAAKIALIALLAALGISLAGAGAIAARRGQPTVGS